MEGRGERCWPRWRAAKCNVPPFEAVEEVVALLQLRDLVDAGDARRVRAADEGGARLARLQQNGARLLIGVGRRSVVVAVVAGALRAARAVRVELDLDEEVRTADEGRSLCRGEAQHAHRLLVGLCDLAEAEAALPTHVLARRQHAARAAVVEGRAERALREEAAVERVHGGGCVGARGASSAGQRRTEQGREWSVRGSGGEQRASAGGGGQGRRPTERAGGSGTRGGGASRVAEEGHVAAEEGSRHGRAAEVMECHGRAAEVMEGHGRSWKGSGGGLSSHRR